MMHNILSGLPILGILPIILTIHPTILAIPESGRVKTPIDVDVSGPRPKKIKASPSTEFPGGTNYTIQKYYIHTHVISTVRDAEEVLIDGDPTAVTRYVLVHPREDGGKYVRIITRWRNADRTFRTAIDEFRRGPIDLYYMQIFRMPINVNLITQESDHLIKVEAIPEDIETMPILFTIQPEVDMEVMIGMVKYGHYIVDDKVDGLMERRVIWDGGLDDPTITITSRYNDGRGTETKYKFVGEEEGFIPYWRRLFFIKLNE